MGGGGGKGCGTLTSACYMGNSLFLGCQGLVNYFYGYAHLSRYLFVCLLLLLFFFFFFFFFGGGVCQFPQVFFWGCQFINVAFMVFLL